MESVRYLQCNRNTLSFVQLALAFWAFLLLFYAFFVDFLCVFVDFLRVFRVLRWFWLYCHLPPILVCHLLVEILNKWRYEMKRLMPWPGLEPQTFGIWGQRLTIVPNPHNENSKKYFRMHSYIKLFHFYFLKPSV